MQPNRMDESGLGYSRVMQKMQNPDALNVTQSRLDEIDRRM